MKLKPAYLIFPLLLLFTGLASAQNTFTAGLHGGLSGTQVDGDGLSGFHKLGFVAGVYVFTDLSERWRVDLELNYNQKGSKTDNSEDEAPSVYQYRMTLDYAQIVVPFTFRTSENLGFFAGPAIGVLVRNKEEDFLGEISNLPEFEKMEISAVFGGRYNFGENWAIEVRADRSLLPIRRKDSGTNLLRLDGKQYNSVVSFLLKYHF